MKLSFSKYHGTGNDFVIIDIRNRAIRLEADSIAQLCHRRFGIGADGLILLDISAENDFSMRYFNSDGNESSMCGNGGRCITAFAKKLGIIGSEARFDAADGVHYATILCEKDHISTVKLRMSDVMPASWHEDEIFLDTGSPHLVKICSNIRQLEVEKQGRRIRSEERFMPGGTNVNFIEQTEGNLHIRTFERGVEAETLSCGTGVTAAAIAWALRQQHLESPVKLTSMGGDLTVYFKRTEEVFTDVYLEGPATFVFSGETEI